MNRTIIMLAASFGVSSLMLVDSAIKGAALLLLAATAALLLRRDSAATRHLVWLLAIVALLAVPALSMLLPQWRVLPTWASVPQDATPQAAPLEARPLQASAASVRPPAVAMSAEPTPERTPTAGLSERTPPSATQAPAADLLAPPPPAMAVATTTTSDRATPQAASWNWINALPLLWAIGFSALSLRLLAARLLLWNSEAQGTVVHSSTRRGAIDEDDDDPLITALNAARRQLGISRPITLLIHPHKSIPVVWGIFRSRLLLPLAAREWSSDQLRSVLLHELAHVKRRDTLSQLLTQVACALHWFNPLVWVAAWRLGVERERACDDLVLASGVRPSAYAGHLLDVVTNLSPARGTQACGLAMARMSSLEGRLVAVVSKDCNRRGVSMALAAIALAIAVGVAVPIAALRAADDKAPDEAAEKPAEKPKPMTAASTRPVVIMKLDPALESRLKWGEAVNGLRAAVAIRNVGETKATEQPDLFVAVQNVSDAPIRLTDADVPANVNLRTLYLRIDGKIMMGLGAREPAWGGHSLQPREVVFLPMLDTMTKLKSSTDPTLDNHTIGSHLAEVALKDPRHSFFVKLEIANAPAGAWTGKLKTDNTTAADAAGTPQPKDKAGQVLFRLWQEHARANGNFPGGLIAELGDKVKEFIKNNSGDAGGDSYAKKMAPLVPRFDGTRDWTPAEVIALFDDIAAAHSIPLETTRERIESRTFRKGAPLPKQLADAPWGEAQPNGLRVAWLLEPRAAEHRLNAPLKSRILVHNSGKNVVVFRAPTFLQSGGHKALDANGKELNIDSTYWTTLSQLWPYRLWPGEYMEVMSVAGIGVGARDKDAEDWQNIRVGSWIDARAGDDVTFIPDAVPLGDEIEDRALAGEPRWWLDFIKAELSRNLPLPDDAEERKRLVYRAGMRLFGTPLTAEEIASFVTDRTPDALDNAAKRLAHRPGTVSFTGSLVSGKTKFRVLPADPDAAKKPRTVKGPGWYTIRPRVVLSVTRRPDGDRIVNEAAIRFFAADTGWPLPGEPYQLKLPAGYDTWAVTWVRGENVLWLIDQGTIRSYDISDPAKVKETTIEQPEEGEKVPKAILDALRGAIATPKPASDTSR